MLVLSRLPHEIVDLIVGNIRIEICLCDVRGDKARLGFTAPPEVGIFRREITDAALADRNGDTAETLETATTQE